MIRTARPQDAQAIADIWNPVIRDTLITFNSVEKTARDVAAMIRDKDDAGQAFLVAEDNGQIVGFATYGQFRGGIGYARTMEHTVILGPAGQGRGLGRALMTAIEDHARAGGAHSIFAGVSAANPAGARFHAALGYQQVARLRQVGFKNGQWLDLVLMQKLLT